MKKGTTHVGISHNNSETLYGLSNNFTHSEACNDNRKIAFTLAEVLITLGIIGVVSAMTIPTLISDVQNRQFTTGSKKMDSTLRQVLMLMKANDVLTGHTTTESFMRELQNYIKTSKLCSVDDLNECFSKEFMVEDDAFTLADMSTAKSLGKDWDTNINGVVLNNGATLLLAYNPKCHNDDYNNCIAVTYDLNGIDNKSKYAGNSPSDIGLHNAIFEKGLQCTVSNRIVNCPGVTYTYEWFEKNFSYLTDLCVADGNPGGAWMDKYNPSAPRCSCIAKGTMITLANGREKPIELITYEDELLVWDFDNGKLSTSKALWIKKPEVAVKYNLLTFSDSRQLKTINQHRIFNKELGKFTYPMTDETPIGTTTLLSDGCEVQLTNKKVIEQPVEFYNIITANHFNCFATGICTSNRFNNLYPIKDYKFVKDNRKLLPYEEYENFVSREWYEKLRLAEQVCDQDMKLYLANLIKIQQREMISV